MNAHIFEVPVRDWHCPACDMRDRTQKPGAHTQFHNCPALGGLGVPMVEVYDYDTRAQARQLIHAGEHGALASVITEHMSGRVDCTVFPITARGGAQAL